MSTSRFLTLIALVAMLTLLVGCSSGNSPVEPVNDAVLSAGDLPMMVETHADSLYSGTGILGVYELNIDSENPENNYLVPSRSLSIGEDYLVSGRGFFDVFPCPNCVKWIQSVWQEIDLKCRWNPDYFMWELVHYCCLTVDPHIWHPFDEGDPSQEPSGTNRDDLDVFDVAVVVVPDDGNAVYWPEMDTYSYCTICQNVDGYTTELANLIDDLTACPYFLVVDDSIDADPPVSTNNRFAQGTQDLEFLMSFYDGGKFYLYITMGYGSSARKAQRLNPKYYLPEFNRKRAWKVNAFGPWQDNGVCPLIGDTWNDRDTQEEFPVTVEVWDWQQQATEWDGSGDYSDADSDHVYASSKVGEVAVEMPGLFTGLKTKNTEDMGTGLPHDPLIYTFMISNEDLLEPGFYTGLVKVTDERVPGSINDGRGYLIHSPDGIALISYEIPEYVTYQKFPFFVVKGCGPISGDIVRPLDCPLSGLPTGSTVDFEVTASSDNGGDPIVLYEIDYCYDGATFNVDDSNATGLFTAGPFVPPDPCEDNIPYTCTVAFRATDSCVPPNVEIFVTCDVTIDICCSDQELYYDWQGCNGMSCQGWQAGGCGLPNNSDLGYGSFNWRCPHGNRCSNNLVPSYMTSDWNPNYSFCSNFHYYNPDMNAVSPVINLPPSDDGVIEWYYCMYRGSGCTYRLYISEAGCSGPWTELWNTTTDDCHNPSVDISSYSGSNIMFRYRYHGSGYQFSYGNCGSAGVTTDNVSINGCFSGTLSD